jgi:hypothetical protein
MFIKSRFKLPAVLLILALFTSRVYCQNNPSASPAGGQAAVSVAKAKAKVKFEPTTDRNPFVSKAELEAAERARLEKERREAEARAKADLEEKKRQEELKRKRAIELEDLRNPARHIINRIKVSGIIGEDALVNGKIAGKGDKVLGATIERVDSASGQVHFVFKGQRFKRQMPGVDVDVE